MTRNKLYFFLSAACMIGYVWIAITYRSHNCTRDVAYHACIIKQLTNIPCPSCGSSRSIVCLLHGQFAQAVWWNPLGIVSFLIIAIAPWWIACDVIQKRSSFFVFYQKTEIFVRQRLVAAVLIGLVVINWIWNIYKGI